MDKWQASIEHWLGYAVAWGDTASWIQAIGGIIAIGFGFLGVYWQQAHTRKETRRVRHDVGYAAALLACRTTSQVAERLAAASWPGEGKRMGLRLRGDRTNELVETLRAIDVLALPPEMIVAFASLRSRLFAVNARISEIYRSEAADEYDEGQRAGRIKSSLVIYDQAVEDFQAMAQALHPGRTHTMSVEEPPSLRASITAAKRKP